LDLSYALIFIGEKNSKKECWIKSKPSFFDAVLLSNKSPHHTKSSPYQQISLDYYTELSFQFSDSDVQLKCDGETLQIIEGETQLSEDEVYDLINNFVIKQGSKITILNTHGYRNNIKRRKYTPNDAPNLSIADTVMTQN
jgi:hypothetical protein